MIKAFKFLIFLTILTIFVVSMVAAREQEKAIFKTIFSFSQRAGQTWDSDSFARVAYSIYCDPSRVKHCQISLVKNDAVIKQVPQDINENKCLACFAFEERVPLFREPVELRVVGQPTLLQSLKYFFYVAVAAMIGVFALGYQLLRMRARMLSAEVQHLKFESEVKDKMSKVARQMAHDIRSPLTALNAIKGVIESQVDREIVKLLSQSIDRISAIAEDILQKGREWAVEISPRMVRFNAIQAIEELIDEKRMSFPMATFEMRSDLKSTEVHLSQGAFKRVVSNILNNAVESYPQKDGTIFVFCESKENFFLFDIVDRGHGVPREILQKLGKVPEITSKKNGNGLGVYNARQTVEAWGGRFAIESEVSNGTRVSIAVPLANPL